MLRELYIENLAVIAQATITFDGRLNVFTGETGAGKSILIHGINAVLGQRVTKDLVRTGCNKAIITALFTDLTQPTLDVLRNLGLTAEDAELTLTREIFADGGSVARVNGKTAAVSVMREIGETLITIHGQHDNQILLAAEQHLQVLDAFGGDDSCLHAYQESFRALQTCARELGKLRKAELEKQQRSSILEAQIADIGALNLQRDEEAALEEEFNIALHATQIQEAIQSAFALLGDEDAAGDLLRQAETCLQDTAELYPALAPLGERLTAARIEIGDVATELSALLNGIDVDGERFAALSARRDALQLLKRRYLCDGNGLLDLYDAAVAEMESIAGAGAEIAHLEEQKAALLQAVTEKAKALSAYRTETAQRFVKSVTEELTFLDMPHVTLAVQFMPGKLTLHGMETVEFLISANPGEQPKPIAKIASGGELSRIMLALKSVIADRDAMPTMIFDEVDTGVSGRAAQKIGIKLREIGGVRQVLCVTHLSQIAVMADAHLLIEKKLLDGRTVTQVSLLDTEGRTREIARIMGGENPSRLMLETAAAEIAAAQR